MTHAIDLPQHLYGYVDRAYLGRASHVEGAGGAATTWAWEPAILFGLTSTPGRALGLTVLLECGAIYRQLPPHAWSFDRAEVPWALPDAQVWDCLGYDATAVVYRYLAGMPVQTRERQAGVYQFSVEWYGDGFSLEPSQSKTLHAIRLKNGRLTFQPGDRLLWTDHSFTTHDGAWPTWLRRADAIYHVDGFGAAR